MSLLSRRSTRSLAPALASALAIALFLPARAAAEPPGGASPSPPAASAPEAEPDPIMAKRSRSRRGGFTLGGMLGFGVASMAGYPNDLSKIGRFSAYSESGVLPSVFAAGWIGGALTDWFVFGIGGGGGSMLAGDDSASTSGLLFHIEAFPLFPVGGRWQDVGVMLEAGTGWASYTSVESPDKPIIDGPGSSYIGGGVFYEGLRAWKLSMGPYLAGNYYWMDTIRRPAIFLGWRTALYTKP